MTAAILSIQSHVAYGYVGNRAATFPMQLLGYDVWAVNTVQFSNHTGYGEWTGDVFPAKHIDDLINGIESRGKMHKCQALLSGYMGDASIGEAILSALDKIKQHNPDAIFCCDPVMGDVGRGFFVRPGIYEFIRDHVIKKADIITPNQFEVEALTGLKIEKLDDAKKICEKLHNTGPEIVLITSIRTSDIDPKKIYMLLSTPEGVWTISTPYLSLPIAPNGAGDMVASIFLARFLQSQCPIDALQKMTSSIYSVFQETEASGERELQLISVQSQISNPLHQFKAEKL